MNGIIARQNTDAALELLAAQRVLYSRAKIFRFLRVLGAVLLVLIGGVVSVVSPQLGAYTAALTAAWCFVVQAVITPLERREQRRGAAIQERFDRQVFGFGDADARLGVLDEDIAAAAKGVDRVPLRDWYETDSRLPEAIAILLAQRSNLAWDRTQRLNYSWFVFGTATMLLVADIALALVIKLTLVDALLLLLCPSLPAFAHAVDLWRDHRNAATEKETFLADVDEKWTEVKADPTSLTPLRLAAVQSEIFRMRAEHVPIPDLAHRLLKTGLHETAKNVLARRLAELGI